MGGYARRALHLRIQIPHAAPRRLSRPIARPRLDLFPRGRREVSEVEAMDPAARRHGDAGRDRVWKRRDSGPPVRSRSRREPRTPGGKPSEIGERPGETARSRDARQPCDTRGVEEEADLPTRQARSQEWMRAERENPSRLGIECSPWPLDHVCRAARRSNSSVGSNRERRGTRQRSMRPRSRTRVRR